ncbi:MAG: SUMF1/EgtB/PvdO family nonheme iron enzyme [Thermoflexales bacterium]|nr:SUMF1/EgtB/PvdO family nonheme iron enzyme [Thermoflexales bacterium]
MNAAKKASKRWSIVLVIGALALCAAGSAMWARLRQPRLAEGDVRLLRQLAVSDVPQLAELLDRSVVYVAAGEFIMGSDSGRDDERPRHTVYLDAFEMDRYEVTNAQYQRYLRAADRRPPPYWSGDEYPPGQADYPVVGVSWDDADAYCTWAGKRLPTEAEWEKACRGTDARLYPWGDRWEPRRANVDVSIQTLRGASKTASEPTVWDKTWQLVQRTPAPGQPGLRPVGSYADGASPYGIQDLAGNASEWVADWYNWGDYSKLPARNPFVSEPPWNRCLRGGPWHDPVGTAAWVQTMSRCSARNSAHEISDPRVGFRCAR